MNFLQWPITLDSSKDSPSISLWGAILAFFLPVWGGVLLISLFLAGFTKGAAPSVLMFFGAVVFFLLYRGRSEPHRKVIKSASDLSSNIWTALGVLYLFYALANNGQEFNSLLKADDAVSAFLFGWVGSTAAGRVAISLSDTFSKPK